MDRAVGTRRCISVADYHGCLLLAWGPATPLRYVQDDSQGTYYAQDDGKAFTMSRRSQFADDRLFTAMGFCEINQFVRVDNPKRRQRTGQDMKPIVITWGCRPQPKYGRSSDSVPLNPKKPK